MGYSSQLHRTAAREQCLQLVRMGGPGWDPYALTKAKQLEDEFPHLHNGLVAAVEAEIGPKRTSEARTALRYFQSRR